MMDETKPEQEQKKEIRTLILQWSTDYFLPAISFA